jgi:hypothetical protein
MIEFGGVIYYIDINAFDKAVTTPNNKTKEKVTQSDKKIVTDENGRVIGTETLEHIHERGKEIDAAKYEVLRLMLEVLVDYDEEFDVSLGADRALDKASLSYKLAFNTLYNYGILKEKEIDE